MEIIVAPGSAYEKNRYDFFRFLYARSRRENSTIHQGVNKKTLEIKDSVHKVISSLLKDKVHHTRMKAAITLPREVTLPREEVQHFHIQPYS